MFTIALVFLVVCFVVWLIGSLIPGAIPANVLQVCFVLWIIALIVVIICVCLGQTSFVWRR